MSITHSISTESSSSSATIPPIQTNDQPVDSSNILYNNRQHYQTIFSNDSRFFDTSLHLFKSYRDLDYIKIDNEKLKKRLFPTTSNTLKPISNGSNGRWRPKNAGFSSNHDINGNLNGTLKPPLPPFLRNLDHLHSHRSDPGSSRLKILKLKREKSPKTVHFQRQSVPPKANDDNDDDSDEPDIIITRL